MPFAPISQTKNQGKIVSDDQPQTDRQNDVIISSYSPMSRTRQSNMAMLAMCACGIGIDNPFVVQKRYQEVEKRICPKCGDSYIYDRPFCSAECCRAHDAEKPKEPRRVKLDKRLKKKKKLTK